MEQVSCNPLFEDQDTDYRMTVNDGDGDSVVDSYDKWDILEEVPLRLTESLQAISYDILCKLGSVSSESEVSSKSSPTKERWLLHQLLGIRCPREQKAPQATPGQAKDPITDVESPRDGGKNRQDSKKTKARTVRQSLLKEKITIFNDICLSLKMSFYSISCLMALSLLPVAHSTLVEFPENAIILEHESSKTIDMACKSDSQYNLRWFVQKNHDSEKETLYNGYFFHSEAKSYSTVITDEPGKYYLRLRNTAEAAQTYICLEPGSLSEVSADLIWLSDLECNDSSNKDLVNLTCSVEFRGNWAPMMEWKEHSSNGEKFLSVGVKTDSVPNQRVTSTLIMPVQDGSRNYTCTTKFDIGGKPPHTTATNVPEYDQIWTSSMMTKSEDDSFPDRHYNETQINAFQNESSRTLIAATAIVATIVFAATLIMFVVLYTCKKIKKNTRNQNQEENQRGSGTLKSGLNPLHDDIATPPLLWLRGSASPKPE